MDERFDERLRRVEEFVAAQVERDKAQAERYDNILREIECLHSGVNGITSKLQNGLLTATNANTEWRNKHQEEHEKAEKEREDAEKETKRNWKDIAFKAIGQVVTAALGAIITTIGLVVSGHLKVTP